MPTTRFVHELVERIDATEHGGGARAPPDLRRERFRRASRNGQLHSRFREHGIRDRDERCEVRLLHVPVEACHDRGSARCGGVDRPLGAARPLVARREDEHRRRRVVGREAARIAVGDGDDQRSPFEEPPLQSTAP